MAMGSAVLRFAKGRWSEPAGVALVLALSVVGSVVEAYPAHHYAGLHLRTHPDPAEFAIVGVPAVLLWWRRSHPVTVYLAAVAGVAGWAALGQVYGASLVVVLVALYSLAVATPSRILVASLGAGGALTIWLVGGLLGPWGWLGGPQLDMWFEMLAAGAVGAAVAARRQWRASERLRSAQLEHAREEETRRRVDSERLRIARELHDVVAHSIAMINVQASAAATLLGDDPGRVADALQSIRDASKTGLRELRSILDVLRQVDGGQPAVPLPGQEAFHALADAATAAGTVTRLHCETHVADLRPETALGAYRIVQESLTNVIRHAPESTADVTIAARGGLLVIDVVNDGVRHHEPFVEGAGTGLAGMEERVRVLGGSMRAGPVATGGFGVHAELPITALAPDAEPLAPREVVSS
jgi:signal transduction histidine kinase